MTAPTPKGDDEPLCGHIRHVIYSKVRRRWRARCICGFKGAWAHRDFAVRESYHHVAERTADAR